MLWEGGCKNYENVLLQSYHSVQTIAGCRRLCKDNNECALFFVKYNSNDEKFICHLFKEEGIWNCVKYTTTDQNIAYSVNTCTGKLLLLIS